MTENKEPTVAAKKPPKGGRKGGTTFPRVGLKKALEYSQKLVRKTHTGPQPEDAILRGVFENVGPEGGVRASALKQYGLLEASAEGLKASDLARKLVAAPPEEQAALQQQAFLRPKPFKKIFDTYNGDAVSIAKIRQGALGLKVHLDSVDECVRLFIESAVLVGLATQDGDSLSLVQSKTIVPAADLKEGEPTVPQNAGDLANAEDGATVAGTTDAQDTANTRNAGGESGKGIRHTEKAAVAVNLNVDSSSDPDKLEKQLKLLRQYGVI